MTVQVRRLVMGLTTTILFPRDVATVDLDDEANLRAFERAEAEDGHCVAAIRRAPGRPIDVMEVGTLARIVSATPLADGRQRIVLQGLRRVRLEEIEARDGVIQAVATALGASFDDEEAAPAADLERLRVVLRELNELDPAYSVELAEMIPLYGEDAERITDLASSVLPLPFELRARLLAEPGPMERLAILMQTLVAELEQRKREKPEPRSSRSSPRSETKPEEEPARWLEQSFHAREIERLSQRITRAGFSPAAREVFTRELEHLRHASPFSPEAPRIRAYLDWSLELPWPTFPAAPETDRLELVAEVLSKSHVGLADVKQRIVELLAVRQLGGGARGTVLCFLGPPGTGKSSMGRAVAEALGRRLLSIPLGAMVHEREIVGVSHRRQGATPGAILAGLHRCGSSNPIILLDEIDKVSLGGEGNASGALLSLLDADQNAEFLDHYLGVPFDLSQCLFLATANDSDEIPEALLDRMEIILFNGYTDSEKYQIAREHLLPRARAQSGIDSDTLRVSPAALRSIIRDYTEEAGVRHLQRVLMALGRKAAVQVVRGGHGLSVKKGDLVSLLGPRIVDDEPRQLRPTIGAATGLAWTAVGGATLPIEALAMPGSGNMILTGQIGDVMRESVQTAVSYVRTRFKRLGLRHEMLEELDVHIHFPSAATPKDGPSAGIAVATALVSLLTLRPARHDIAMTGEMSLLGSVLPVGGLREKLLAAIRAGMPEVIVPRRNAEEVDRMPPEVRDRLRIHLVDDVQDVLGLALVEGRPGTQNAVYGRPALRRVARQAKPKPTERDRDAG